MSTAHPTTIETVTVEQVEELRAGAATAGDEETVRLCGAALRPEVGARVRWDVGPSGDHDAGRFVAAMRIVGVEVWTTTITWDSGTTTVQGYDIIPTEAAHACVDAINEAELA